jgi:hypothetical protein
LSDELVEVVRETMQPSHVSLIERTTTGGERLVESGGPSVLLPTALLSGSGIFGYAIVIRRE